MGIGLLLNGSIEVDNYKIYNTAKLQGEGVDILLNEGGNIEFSNCTICNNTAHVQGGG